MSEENKKSLTVIYLSRVILGQMDRVATYEDIDSLIKKFDAPGTMIRLTDLSGILRGSDIYIRKDVIDGIMPMIDSK